MLVQKNQECYIQSSYISEVELISAPVNVRRRETEFSVILLLPPDHTAFLSDTFRGNFLLLFLEELTCQTEISGYL